MILPRLLLQWPIEWYELWCERAAIQEFEGGMSRPAAELAAEKDIRRIAETVDGPVQEDLGLEMKF